MDPAAWSRGGFNRGLVSGTWKGSGGFKLAKSIRVFERGEVADRTLEMGAVKNYWMDGFICGESVSVGDEQMSAQDSHYTYASGMLPSLGARSNPASSLGDFLFPLMILDTGLGKRS